MSKYGTEMCILRFVDRNDRLQLCVPEDDERWDAFDELVEAAAEKRLPTDEVMAKFADLPVIDVKASGRLGSFSMGYEKKFYGPKNTQKPHYL